jgi:hypothetical protein
MKIDNLGLRTVVMIVAGPMANLLSVLVVVLLPIRMGFARFAFVLASLSLGTINLVPFRNRAQLSDGLRIAMLLRNRARGERWLAILKIVAELADGTPPESYSPEYLELATAVRDGTSDTVTAHALAYSSAFHRKRDDEAAQMLEIALEYSGYAAPIVRDALMTDAAVFQGRRRKRADLAEAWLADLPDRTEIPWLRDLAQAGVSEAQGEIARALGALERAEQRIRVESNRVRRDASLRSIKRWRTDLKTQGAIS